MAYKDYNLTISDLLERDAMVFPIYEGTTQIQALMAMKDALMGAVKDPRRFLARTALARWRSVSGDVDSRRVATLRLHAQQAQQFGAGVTAPADQRQLHDAGSCQPG